MLNVITVMGRMVKDPELRYTQSQKAVVTFTLAVDRDLQKGETDFIDCVAWGGTGEFVSRNFRRGSMAVVNGSMQSRKWEDREGNKRVSWNINVQNIWFGEAKRRDGHAQMDGGEQQYGVREDDGGLPF